MAVTLARMFQRRDTPEGWNAANPVLGDGEFGKEEVPGAELARIKIGDGVTPWIDLPYIGGDEPDVPDMTNVFEEELG